ncbi:MAG: TatD family hydrolase [Candidatus Wukongarchaeota archaeon]|nr:TatD family hydrolase [Candidatus Wukongarchaeota archaeon]
MHIIDAHAHVDTHSMSDFEAIALSGVTDIVTCAHDFLPRISVPEVLYDHWHRLLTYEPIRVEKFGIKLHVALGIHPQGIPKTRAKEAINVLEQYIDHERVVAIGETGLDLASVEEIDVLKGQIKVAEKFDKPIIIHTPRKNKKQVLEKILMIVKDSSISLERVIVDHLNEETVPIAGREGVWMGLSVQPGKLAPEDVLNIVRKFGSEKFVLNSDLGSALSDIFSLSKTVLKLKLEKVSEEDIINLAYLNAKKIFSI